VGLGLIFAVMRSQEMEAAMLSTPFREQLITRRTRRLLYSGCWFVRRPDEDFVPDRPRRKPAVQTANFVAALGTQPVIHRHRTDLSVPLAGPAIRQNGESETIGAAGHCDGEKRSGLEESERGERAAKLGEG